MASKHLVVCVSCGRQFDANRGGYYNKRSRRYTCKSCGKTQIVSEREHRTGMKQSTGAMIAKIAAGILFVLAGFSSPDSGWSIGYFLTALVVGGALIAWGIVPYLKVQKAKKQEEVSMRKVAEQRINSTKKCASCGAIGTGEFCEYCGQKYF